MSFADRIGVRQSALARHLGHLGIDGRTVPCTLGPGGIVADKREGDASTPRGNWEMRCLLYRGDRMRRPRTGLDVHAIHPNDGWCDDPADRMYNRPVQLPYAASAESLYRDDRLYDLLVVLGHNDAPVAPGRGSCIFFHVMSPQRGPTAGCVAVEPHHMLDILKHCGPDTRMVIG